MDRPLFLAIIQLLYHIPHVIKIVTQIEQNVYICLHKQSKRPIYSRFTFLSILSFVTNLQRKYL